MMKIPPNPMLNNSPFFMIHPRIQILTQDSQTGTYNSSALGQGKHKKHNFYILLYNL